MDHVAKALTRVYWQYRNSPKLKAWMQILPALAQARIETPLEQIVNILDIDTASGHQLDIIGRIAGIETRPRIAPEDAFFGYKDTPGATNYGLAPYIGREPLASYPVPDFLFRVIIRAKIYKNVSTVTIDGVKEAVDFILDENSEVVDGQDMTIEAIWLTKPLGPNLRKIVEDLDLIPRPQGVRIRRIDRRPVPEDYLTVAPEFVAYMSEFDIAMNYSWPAA